MLPDVATYFKGVLECQPELVGEATVALLYQRGPTGIEQPAASAPFGGEVLAIILADDALRTARAEEISERRVAISGAAFRSISSEPWRSEWGGHQSGFS